MSDAHSLHLRSAIRDQEASTSTHCSALLPVPLANSYWMCAGGLASDQLRPGLLSVATRDALFKAEVLALKDLLALRAT